MGSQFSLWQVQIGDDKEMYADVFKTEYAITTSEGDCKWHWIRPNQNEWRLDRCAETFKFAADNDIKFRGHNLCWGVFNPPWLANFSGSAQQLDEILKEHITKVMQEVPKMAGVKDKILAWDVVNEAV